MGHLSTRPMVKQNKTRKGIVPRGAYCPAENRDEHQAIGLHSSKVGLRVLLKGHPASLGSGKDGREQTWKHE